MTVIIFYKQCVFNGLCLVLDMDVSRFLRRISYIYFYRR